MKINCSNFKVSTSSKVRVYNTLPYLLRSVNIYFVCEDTSLYNELLTRDNEGNIKFKIKVDNIVYEIEKGTPGSSPINPIVFKKDLSTAKIKFPNVYNNYETAIGGSNNSLILTDWIEGTNIGEIDDYIDIEIQIDHLTSQIGKFHGYGELGYGEDLEFGKLILYGGGEANIIILQDGYIIIEPSIEDGDLLPYYSSDSILKSSKLKSFGFGQTSFGGSIAGQFDESIGGVLAEDIP